MALEQTWRWFGPADPISLKEIKQTGATGIVTALHQIPVGEVWPVEEILKRKAIIASEGLTWSVAESVPVHEDIKKRTGNYRRSLENYAASIRNLGQCGIDIVCYNFMPILDWSRTDLRVEFKDGSITTKFETKAFAAFDLFILQRPQAEHSYSTVQIRQARQYFSGLSESQKEKLKQTVLLGLPGSLETYTLEELRTAVRGYEEIGEGELRENLIAFIKEIAPVAEEAGVLLAIHPDDPPWPLLGLPRVVRNKADIEQVLQACDSHANGLTFCTGSLGAGFNNNLVEMAENFANKINFIHLRNVACNPEGDFIEDNHLEGNVDMFGVMRALLLEQKRRIEAGRKDHRMPMRPDHGHLMLPDQHRKNLYPGYSLFGRMRGLAELRGLELGIQRSLQLS
ncbi:mannonate dehydratase [candidate division KSB1 bacterium]|nr:MAG: mannonate dehydratase [candidate division KSB1 bacterium]